MEIRPREVRVRHLHRVVKPPERSTETVANPDEPTARRRVSLEHQQFLALRLCIRG